MNLFALIYEKQAKKITVGINPNTELIYTILNLTEFSKKLRGETLKPLTSSILKHFKQHSKHPAVMELEKDGKLNWYKGFCYDEVIEYTLYFSDMPEGKRIYNYKDGFLSRILDGMSKDEKIKYLDAYWEKIRDFYKTVDFANFLEGNTEYYKFYVDIVYKGLPPFDIVKMQEDYHNNYKFKNFYLVPSLLGLPTSGSYGMHMENSIIIFIAGSLGNSNYIRDKLFHEVGHPFCNPIVEKYYTEVSKYKFLMKGLRADMQRQGYGSWSSIMNEYLVRSIHARFVLKTEGKEAAKIFLLKEEQNHKFVFINQFYDLLDVFEKNRDKYSNLYDFYPTLIDALSEWELREVDELIPVGIWTHRIDKGLSIFSIDSSKFGYKAGFRMKDTVVKVDGKKPGASFFLTLEIGKTYSVSVIRKDGKSETFKFTPKAHKILRPVHKPKKL